MTTLNNNIGNMTLPQLQQHLNSVRREIHRIEDLKGNTKDMDWDKMEHLAVEMGRTLNAIDAMNQVTLDEALGLRPTDWHEV